ncbi:MAG: preprotein translocase subunit SecG [Dehalococcoidia bacterium]|nr:preprotein translocase subunit SecG [Dehalococcoidia bacterium]
MIFTYLTIIVSVLLIIVILLQVRGTGTALFGQGENSFRVRRGFERTLFRSTIILGVIFVIVAVLNVRFN